MSGTRALSRSERVAAARVLARHWNTRAAASLSEEQTTLRGGEGRARAREMCSKAEPVTGRSSGDEFGHDLRCPAPTVGDGVGWIDDGKRGVTVVDVPCRGNLLWREDGPEDVAGGGPCRDEPEVPGQVI